jgi:hypothetical protein
MFNGWDTYSNMFHRNKCLEIVPLFECGFNQHLIGDLTSNNLE